MVLIYSRSRDISLIWFVEVEFNVVTEWQGFHQYLLGFSVEFSERVEFFKIYENLTVILCWKNRSVENFKHFQQYFCVFSIFFCFEFYWKFNLFFKDLFIKNVRILRNMTKSKQESQTVLVFMKKNSESILKRVFVLESWSWETFRWISSVAIVLKNSDFFRYIIVR